MAEKPAKEPLNVLNDEKKMTDAMNAIAKLSWSQLLALQANLADHVLGCYQQHLMKRLAQENEHAKALEMSQSEEIVQ
jgi:hypothetical protein